LVLTSIGVKSREGPLTVCLSSGVDRNSRVVDILKGFPQAGCDDLECVIQLESHLQILEVLGKVKFEFEISPLLLAPAGLLPKFVIVIVSGALRRSVKVSLSASILPSLMVLYAMKKTKR